MYSSVSEIRDNIAGLTPNNTKIDDNYISTVIDRKSAIINSYISARYKLPIRESTSPTAFNILKDVVITLCRAEIHAKLKVATKTDTQSSQFPLRKPPESVALEFLMAIRNGKMDLSDAELCAECEVISTGDYDYEEVDGTIDQREPEVSRGRRVR